MDILRMILFCILLLGQTIFLIRKNHIHAWLAPLVTVLGDTLILYIFAISGLLEFGFYFVLVLSIFLSFFAFIPIKRLPDGLWFSIPIVALIILTGFSWYYTRGAQIYRFDEFTHWGILFRYLTSTNHLPVMDPAGPKSVFYNTPPFTALFQYYTTRIIGVSESNVYFAQMIMQFSAIIALIRIIKWNQWFKYLLVFGAIMVAIVGLDFGELLLLVDLLLGLFFAVGLAQILWMEDLSTNEVLITVLACCALTLTKPIGVVFAYLIILTLVVMQFKWSISETAFKVTLANFLRRLIRPQMLIIILAPLVLLITWQIVSPKNNQVTTRFSLSSPAADSSDIFPVSVTEYQQKLLDQERQERIDFWLTFIPSTRVISLTDIIRSFTNNTIYRNKLIILNFINTISEKQYGASDFTPKAVLVLILTIAVLNQALFFQNGSRGKNDFWLVNILLFFGFMFYCLILYQAYIYQWRPFAGSLTPQLSRYLASFFLGWLILNLITIGENRLVKTKPSRFNISQSILASFILLGVLFIPTSRFIHLPYSADYYRQRANRIYESINQVGFTEQDKVYDVFHEDDFAQGFNHMIIRYLLTPISTNLHGWELGQITKNMDYYTVPFTPQEWMKLLHDQGYTYVLVSQANDNFWSHYSSLFDRFDKDEDGQLFLVNKDRLEKIDLGNN